MMKDELSDLEMELDEVYESSVPLEVFMDRQRATPGSILSAIYLEPGDVVAVREARGAIAPGLGFDLPAEPISHKDLLDWARRTRRYRALPQYGLSVRSAEVKK